MSTQKLSIMGNKIKEMINNDNIDIKTLKEHIRLNRLNKIINIEEEQYLYKLLQHR